MTVAKENDLYELKGIGVDSIKELSHRNAASLTKMIAERHGDVVGLSQRQAAGWIDEAKSRQS